MAGGSRGRARDRRGPAGEQGRFGDLVVGRVLPRRRGPPQDLGWPSRPRQGRRPGTQPGPPAAHRREAEIAAALPPDIPAPRLLWSHDEGKEGRIVLAFEDVDGRNHEEPWRPDELDRVLDALAALAGLLTPSSLPQMTVGSPRE
jgi:hypothetical protein